MSECRSRFLIRILLLNALLLPGGCGSKGGSLEDFYPPEIEYSVIRGDQIERIEISELNGYRLQRFSDCGEGSPVDEYGSFTRNPPIGEIVESPDYEVYAADSVDVEQVCPADRLETVTFLRSGRQFVFDGQNEESHSYSTVRLLRIIRTLYDQTQMNAGERPSP